MNVKVKIEEMRRHLEQRCFCLVMFPQQVYISRKFSEENMTHKKWHRLIENLISSLIIKLQSFKLFVSYTFKV
jgi:hypothetical protein